MLSPCFECLNLCDDIVALVQNSQSGGAKSNRGMCYISWDTLCKSKKEGGMCLIRDIDTLSYALLANTRVADSQISRLFCVKSLET